jgi:hypothetical protein
MRLGTSSTCQRKITLRAAILGLLRCSECSSNPALSIALGEVPGTPGTVLTASKPARASSLS